MICTEQIISDPRKHLTDETGYKVHLPSTFENVHLLARGSSSIVLRAFDTRKQEDVAIKRIELNIANTNDRESRRRAKLIYRELTLLSSLTHPNIISLKYVYSPNGIADFKELYLVTEPQHCNLRTVITYTTLIPHKALSFIIYQLLAAVAHLHRYRILHRELMPEKIGFRNDVTVKLLSPGLAHIRKHSLSRLPQCLYSAPEILLNQQDYDAKADVWSIGCIIAELILHRPLFETPFPGNFFSQMMRILGKPATEFLARLNTDEQRAMLSSTHSEGIPFEEIFHDNLFSDNDPTYPELTSENVRDILRQILKIDPNERPTLDELLKHKYFSRLVRDNECNCPQRPVRYNQQLDCDEHTTVDDWKKMLYAEVRGLQALLA